MTDKIRELLDQRASELEKAEKLNETAEAENRDLSPEELKTFEAHMDSVRAFDARVERAEKLAAEPRHASTRPVERNQAPAVIKQRGDTFQSAMGAYLRRNDTGGLSGLMNENGEIEFRASNATDMNIGTAADGLYAVPTGFYNQVIARRDEGDLASKLRVRNIPGKGTTVNAPLDAEADGEFVSTSEAVAFDLDAPALGTKAFTLVKYSKQILLSVELLRDEDAKLMAFLSDFVARGMAKKRNELLITEVGTNGTSFKTFASTAAIVAGEPEAIVGNNDLDAYLDDNGSVAWVTRPSTHWAIKSITGNPRLYAGANESELLGYPVFKSSKVASPAAAAKSVYFGNWNYVGMREGDGFTLLRDPYSAASTGQVALWIYFDVVFGVLQAEAIGYGKQAAS